MRAVGWVRQLVLDETELTDPRIDARRGIERGSQSWMRQSSLMLVSMHAMGSSGSESWGEIGVVDPDVWSAVGSVAG